MNLPNKLTIFRIILIPIMIIIPFLGIQGTFLNISIENWIIVLIFAIASYTDHLDGMIARKRNLITDFGKFADPIADKALVLSAMIMLVEMQKLPSWIPIIVLTREFVISGYRLVAVEKGGTVIAAGWWGKIKTATQMVGTIAMFLSNYKFFQFVVRRSSTEVIDSIGVYMPLDQYIINIIGSVLIAFSILATIISAWDYLKNAKQLFKEEKA